MLPDFRVRQRDYLLEIARLLTEELDLEKLLARILKIAIEMLAGQAGLIALKKPEGWSVSAAHNIAPAFLSYLTPLLAEEVVRELDVRELNRMLKELTFTASTGLLNGTGLPLAAHGQVIGVIFIFRNYADLFTPNDRVLLQSFADQAAIAVFNAQLYGQVSYEKQRLDALLDSAADGILILDTNQVVERCNAAFEKLYSLTRDDIVGKNHILCLGVPVVKFTGRMRFVFDLSVVCVINKIFKQQHFFLEGHPKKVKYQLKLVSQIKNEI